MKKQLINLIHDRLAGMFRRYGIEDYSFIDVQVPPDRTNGDFSMNAAMKLSKAAKCAPRQLAEEIKAILEAEKDWFSRVDIAGPGFINMYIADGMIEKCFNDKAAGSVILADEALKAEKTVVDYSSVNIAKQMHVGHLRSTIIGDVLARVIVAQFI